MNDEKLTDRLVQRLTLGPADERIDVLLELDPPPLSAEPGDWEGRRAAFARFAEPVEQAVRDAGGEVAGIAWINATMRVRIPTQAVQPLAQHPRVLRLDVPTQLYR